MKRPWFNIIIAAVWVIVFILIAWTFLLGPAYRSYKSHQFDANYAVVQAFNQYGFTLSDLITLNQKIEKAPGPLKAALRQDLTLLQKKFERSSKDLDKALDRIQKYYPFNGLIKKRIQAVEAWKKQSEKQLMVSTDYEWNLSFLKLQMGVNKALDKAETGYEDPTKAKFEKIMSLVPAAEKALKKHPNDQKLCTVMQQPLDVVTNDPHPTAQQIAFFNVGNQYCTHYYADPEAWGNGGAEAHANVILSNPLLFSNGHHILEKNPLKKK